MRRILMIFAFLMFGSLVAQEINLEIDKTVQVILADPEKTFMKPRWSPDGVKIAFTGLNHIGLYVMAANGDDLKILSEDSGAGNNFYWSPDGHMISTVIYTYQQGRREAFLKVFNTDLGQLIQSNPVDHVKNFGFHGFIDNRDLLVNQGIDFDRIKLTADAIQNTPDQMMAGKGKMCLSIGTAMVLYDLQTNEFKPIDPIPGAQYLMPTLSNDQAYLVFRAYADQMYVYDINNDNTIPLGQGYHPRWSSDNSWIIFERQTDDGHNITSADLFIADRSGSRFGQITATPDILEVNPDWSPVSNKIVYEDLATGSIHLLEISNIR